MKKIRVINAIVVMSNSQGKKPFHCIICDYCSAVKSDLKKTNIAAVHDRKKPFQCNLCDAIFSMKHHMKVHKDSVHEGKKPFECNICDFSFAEKKQIATPHSCST